MLYSNTLFSSFTKVDIFINVKKLLKNWLCELIIYAFLFIVQKLDFEGNLKVIHVNVLDVEGNSG